MTHEGVVRLVVDEFNPDLYVYHRFFFYTHEHRWLNIFTWYFSCNVCTFIFAYFFQTSADILTAIWW